MRRVGRFWPSVCVVCRRAGAPGIDLCDACLACLPRLIGPHDTLCARCGERHVGTHVRRASIGPGQADGTDARTNARTNAGTGAGTDTTLCRSCTARSSPFSRLVVPWRYDFPLDRLVARMKYRDERVLARVFGTALARESRRDRPAAGGPDVLLGVPSRATRRESGFDHAAALARWCARECRLPDASALATRIVDTGSLAGLSRAERADRIRGAFRADPRVAGLSIAIVDDVLTSGATAGELARELYDTGAETVELWVLARTPADR